MTHRKLLGIFGTSMLLASALTVTAEGRGALVDLVWSDPYGLFPEQAQEDLREELDRFSVVTDISIRVIFPGRPAAKTLAGTPRIHVTLRPGGARHWGLEDSAMAAAVGERGASHAIFVFVDAVRRTLGHAPTRFSPRELNELTRALARVVEHELVHVLAPDRGHAVSGLMSRKLTRKLLLGKRIELDLTSLVRARDGALRIASLEAPKTSGARGACLPVSVSSAPPPPML